MIKKTMPDHIFNWRDEFDDHVNLFIYNFF